MTRAIRHIIRKIFTTTSPPNWPVPNGTAQTTARPATATAPNAWPPTQRITPARVRVCAAVFAQHRRGYDPHAVHEFLHHVADEIALLRQEAAIAQAEADRIRTHLRKWQSDHAATCRNPNATQARPNPPQQQWIAQPAYQSVGTAWASHR